MESFIAATLTASAEAAAILAGDAEDIALLGAMAALIVQSLRTGGKILIAGNGGSAADAQHIAAEFVSRLMFDRAPLAAIALTANGPVLTACGNDYGFETVFARQVTSLGRTGDVLLALSTSGQSRNLILAGEAAISCGMVTLGFTGATGGGMAASFTKIFRAPSGNAQIVQQLHMVAAHAMLAAVERMMFTTEESA